MMVRWFFRWCMIAGLYGALTGPYWSCVIRLSNPNVFHFNHLLLTYYYLLFSLIPFLTLFYFPTQNRIMYYY